MNKGLILYEKVNEKCKTKFVYTAIFTNRPHREKIYTNRLRISLENLISSESLISWRREGGKKQCTIKETICSAKKRDFKGQWEYNEGGEIREKIPLFRIESRRRRNRYTEAVSGCVSSKSSRSYHIYEIPRTNWLRHHTHARVRAHTHTQHTYIYVDGVNQRGQKVALCPCGNLCIRSRNKTWPARVGNWLKAHVARSSNEKNPEPSLWTCRFCEGEKGKRRFPRFYCPLLRSQFLFCFVRFILPCRDRQNFDPSAPFDPSEKS